MNSVEKAVYLLDLFTKEWCLDKAKTDERHDLTFRCDECPFQDDPYCLVKTFRKEKLPEYKGFGAIVH